MKVKSFLRFDLEHDTGKTKKWSVHGGAGELGSISWYASWRRYCFSPDGYTIWDRDCLTEIVAFIDVQMAERNKK
jgi:hypothetical protein